MSAAAPDDRFNRLLQEATAVAANRRGIWQRVHSAHTPLAKETRLRRRQEAALAAGQQMMWGGNE